MPRRTRNPAKSEYILSRLPVQPPYDLDGWMIAWDADYDDGTRKRGAPDRFTETRVKVGPWPDNWGWSDGYAATSGCCFSHWHHLKSPEEKFNEIFRGFFYLVLLCGINPEALHRELSKIKGYLEYDGRVGFGASCYTFFQGGRLEPYNNDYVVDPYGKNPYQGAHKLVQIDDETVELQWAGDKPQ